MSNFIPYQKVNSKLGILNNYHQAILEEFRSNVANLEFKDFTSEQDQHIKKFSQGYPIGYETYYKANNRELGKWGWHIAPLFAEGNDYTINTNKLPILTQVLKSIGMNTICAINALDPHQSLDWHIDKDYVPGVQLLRVMWGLDIDPNEEESSFIQIKDKIGNIETKKYVNKEFYIFHPMSEHRVENNMNTTRSVLCIDYITDQSYTRVL